MSTPHSKNGGLSPSDPTDPASRQNLSHSPRVIPNIPPRASFSSSQRPNMSLTPHSIPREGRSPGTSGKPSPKASTTSLKKQAISPPGAQQKSALTAAMGSPDKPHMDADIPSVPSPAAHDSNNSHDSGATTPRGPGGADDSGWSNLGEIPDERKAQVLRRHLVSAEERGQSKTGTPTGMSPGNASPIGESGPSGGPGDSAVTYGSTSENPPQVDDQFPIPFDAVGGDVTYVPKSLTKSHS